MDLKSVSLSELVFNVKRQLDTTFSKPIWITAEISELNVNYSGHCYMELVEKEEASDKLLAKSRATIWASVFRIIKPYFETSTRESLKAGLKVLVKVTVEFHEFYGFSLNIHDIDPSYTVGDLVLKRNIIIEKLNDDGVIDMNKAIELPLVIQRIAVITSETAAGYGDFKKQIENNDSGFFINMKLFPAVMQGNGASSSIAMAFNNVFDEIEDFDAVVLIRGGGSKIDLSCFDDYDLAFIIAQFPVPVITGIGHDRDESIADIVANTSLKTPTAVAEFLLDSFEDYWSRIQDSYMAINLSITSFFNEQELLLKDLSSKLNYEVNGQLESRFLHLENRKQLIKSSASQLLKLKQAQVSRVSNSLSVVAKSNISQAQVICNIRKQRLGKWLSNYLQKEEGKLENLNEKLNLVDPQNVLNRGFAIASKNGKTLLDASDIQVGDELKITLSKGEVTGEVKSIKK